MSDVDEFLDLLKQNPDLLSIAPVDNHGAHIKHRTQDEVHQCFRCPARARTAYVLHNERAGHRWLDLCPDCAVWMTRGASR